MKNKKGFTLIELLAVIVILAIIALIATPIILNMINNARKKAAESSAYGFVEAIEYNNGLADVSNDMNLSYEKVIGNDLDVTTINVKLKGKRPTSGTVTIDETGKVTEGDFCIEGYQVTYSGKEVTNVEKGCSGSSSNNESQTGEETSNETDSTSTPVVHKPSIITEEGATHKGIVYMNPTDLTEECTENDIVSTTGTKTGCMKFYIFNDYGDTYRLLLDHNTTATVAYETTGAYKSYEEASIKAVVDADTEGWAGEKRIITADEIALITGNTGWKSSSASMYQYFSFGSNNTTEYADQNADQKARQRSFAWLFNYTKDCKNNGCSEQDSSTEGYWTSSFVFDHAYRAWVVDSYGCIYRNNVDYYEFYGVRPVIILPKTAFAS